MNSAAAERIAIVILGMHRSGTSVLTRLLSFAGAQLPKNPNEPDAWNETGYWEPEPLIAFNDTLLAELGSGWRDWRTIDFSQLSVERLGSIRIQLLNILQEQYGEAAIIAIKDPRLCRLAPVFFDSIEPSFSVRCILAIRSPLEVLLSLKERDGMQPGHAALLWLRHVLDSERRSRDRKRAFVSYSSVLGEWRSTLERVGEHLGIDWPRSAEEVEPEVAAFLRPQMRHHVEAKHVVGGDPITGGWVADVTAAMTVLEEAPFDTGAMKALDDVFAEVERAEGVFGDILNSESRAANDREGASRARRGEAQSRVDAARAKLGLLREQLIALELDLSEAEGLMRRD